MRKSFQSSGDLIADRRYQYGQALFRDREYAAAAELFEQTIELAPEWPSAHWSLGKARQEAGDRAGAAMAFRDCLRLDPEDTLGASLGLADLGVVATFDAAPAAYVKALFDAYAEDFDNALVERLDYTTPQKLAAAIRDARKGESRIRRALDLGCGTGLAGEAIAADVDWLDGVDLSQAMIEIAQSKGVYDRLETAELIAALQSQEESCDLILAADVLNYFGDLGKAFLAVAGRLADGGIFAFSVEKGAGAGWFLQPSYRFAHSPDYVARALAEAGLDLVSICETNLRKDGGADVVGLLVIGKKPAGVH